MIKKAGKQFRHMGGRDAGRALVQTKQMDLTQIRDRQAAYITDLRGQNGSINLQLPANAQYWSKDKIQPNNDPTTNHIFSFTDPKAGKQYRHIQTDSSNPNNVTINGKPLGEMTPKFTDGKLTVFYEICSHKYNRKRLEELSKVL